jgi:acetate kinase
MRKFKLNRWILTLNAGSSSIKYSLFQFKKGKLKIEEKGMVEKIGEEISYFQKTGDKKIKVKIENHAQALGLLLRELKKKIKEPLTLYGVGHRVVHGGEKFKDSVIINSKVLNTIKKFSDLAPLHNPPAVLVISECMKRLKSVPQVAVFDTSFHQTIPERAFIYALPYKFYTRYGIRRYGFHGTSHRYVTMEAARRLGKDIKRLKLITCHLGNGCSITAVDKGRSIDTSMGFTPLEGLVMGTRCGDIDPAIIFYLADKGYRPKEIERILNRKSGLLGLSGISNDMRVIEQKMRKGNRRAKLAYEVFVYRLAKYISAYLGILGGADAVVFTAGIGEHQNRVREDIKKILDPVFKKFRTKILVIPTNEELMIATEVLRLLK